MRINHAILARVSNRLNRFNRLVELDAPDMILEDEYRWFMIEVERFAGAVKGVNIPYTAEQLEELAALAELESILEDEVADEDEDR